MATKEELTYKKASEELESILKALEAEDLDVDKLSGYVKRASELLKFCRTRLRQTEAEVEKIIGDFEADELLQE